MPETLWMNAQDAAPLREGEARTASVFGTAMPGRVALVPRHDAARPTSRSGQDIRQTSNDHETSSGLTLTLTADDGNALLELVRDAISAIEETLDIRRQRDGTNMSPHERERLILYAKLADMLDNGN